MDVLYLIVMFAMLIVGTVAVLWLMKDYEEHKREQKARIIRRLLYKEDGTLDVDIINNEKIMEMIMEYWG